MPSTAQDNQLHQRPKLKFMENKIPHEIAVLKYFSFLLHEFHVLLRFVRKLPYSNWEPQVTSTVLSWSGIRVPENKNTEQKLSYVIVLLIYSFLELLFVPVESHRWSLRIW